MAAQDTSARDDRWGAPQSESSQVADKIAEVDRKRIVRLWVFIGILGAVLVLIVGLYFVQRTLVHSFSSSCRAATQAEDWEQLERVAERWHFWDRNAAAPLIYMAEAANRTERYERAVELLQELPDDDPMTAAALLVRSDILFGPLNRAVEAAETLERAISLDPGLVEARRRLLYFYAYTLQRRKMVDLAYDTIENEADLPETYVYLMLQDSLGFSNAYDENTRWFRGDRENELFLVARAMHRIRSRGLDERQDLAETSSDETAEPLHKRVVAEYMEKFPRNLELLAYNLQLSSTAGDVGEVARLLSLAPPEAANDNRFWRFMGWLYAARGELEQAQSHYERALLLNCYDHISRHQLAGVERRLGHLDQVEMHEQLVAEGKALRRAILQLDNVAAVPPELLQRMASYAEACGDDAVAAQLGERIRQWSAEWARTRPQGPATPY